MKANEFFKIKTNYTEIGIKSILFFGILLLIILTEIFVFWGVFGEGASANRVSESLYVDLILNFLPIILVGGFLAYKTIKEYRKREYEKFKTNIITLLILTFLFLIRKQWDQLIF